MTSSELRIALRCACTPEIGLGHFYRCLTLGDALRREGARPIVLVDGMVLRGSAVDVQKIDAGERHVPYDALVIDDYALSASDIAEFDAPFIGVLDDLADRRLDVDWLLNGAPHAASLPYETRAVKLLGPSYALLREEFAGAPARELGDVHRGFVMMGGSDPRKLSGPACAALAKAGVAAIDLVLGSLADAPDDLPPNVTVHRNTSHVAALMRAADIAVSAAGQSLYELASSGTPTVALAVADNQRPQLASLASLDVVVPSEPAALDAVVSALVMSPAIRRHMSRAGQALVDGQGAARAAQSLISLIHRKTRTHA